jgi:hypothetical protein
LRCRKTLIYELKPFFDPLDTFYQRVNTHLLARKIFGRHGAIAPNGGHRRFEMA